MATAAGAVPVKVPRYYLVKEQILGLIADLSPGDAIPTERELAEQFGTSRTTVRQALAELVVDGRLEREQGRGTFVSRPKLMQVRQLTSFSQDLAADGWRPGSTVLAIATVGADADLAARLEIEPGREVLRIERLRTQADEPIAHEIAWVPGPLPGLTERIEAGDSLYRALAEDHGIDLDAVEDIIETTLADPVTAALLGVDTGLPLLQVHRTAWDTSGRPMEWTSSLFRGDRFRVVARQRLTDPAHPATR